MWKLIRIIEGLITPRNYQQQRGMHLP